MYEYGIIGNCMASAHVEKNGSIDWLCMPRPDSPPIFGRLLDENGGTFSIVPHEQYFSEQFYVANSAVLITQIHCNDGSELTITDFCPRFYQHGRIHRPISLFRIVEPKKASPAIKVLCKPVDGWKKEYVKAERGNSHLKFQFGQDHMRVVSNMSMTYLNEETTFSLKEPIYFGLTWNYGIEEDIAQVARNFLKSTLDYWNVWVKHCSIPSQYQQETIRSAITLKLHCYEDTGAILAALTTSLPEIVGDVRNWDYRFCWLRDAYFTLSAFYNLGHFEEMEGFIRFLLSIAEKHEYSRERLHPVYRLDQTLPVPEMEHPNWQGYRQSKPVRSDNQASDHVQNDVYGEMILTLAPIFFDERFHHLRTRDHENLLSHLAKLCAKNISVADAGLWEVRNGCQEHTFSNVMCWAGLERISRIQKKGYLQELHIDLENSITKAEKAVRSAVRGGSLRNGPTDSSFDASLLQIATLNFPDRDLIRQTIDGVQSNLMIGNDDFESSFLYRYRREDDFGHPDSAFLICSFWLVQALAKSGQIQKARSVMQNAMTSANRLGLFSEHFLPGRKVQSGNFPQAYSHVGQINAAFAVSPSWSDLL